MIEVILFSAAFGYVFAEVSKIPQNFAQWLLKRGYHTYDWQMYNHGFKNPKPYSLKPFTCGMCLSFWSALISAIFLNFDLWHCFGIAFCASLTAVLIKSVDDRFNR